MRNRQDQTLSIQVRLILFSVFIVISDSSLRETYVSRRYNTNNRTIMNLEKNPVLKTGYDKKNAYKHTVVCQSCKSNDLKGSEGKAIIKNLWKMEQL